MIARGWKSARKSKRQTSLVTVVAELEFNSVKPPPDTRRRGKTKHLAVQNTTEKPKSHYSTQSVMIAEEPRWKFRKEKA